MANHSNNPTAKTPADQLNTFNAPERIKIPVDPLKPYIDRNNTSIGNILTNTVRQIYSNSSVSNQTMFEGVVLRCIDNPLDESLEYTEQYESSIRYSGQTGVPFKAYKVFVYHLFDVLLKPGTMSLTAEDYEKINLLPTFYTLDPLATEIPINSKVTVQFSNVKDLSNPTIISFPNAINGTSVDKPFILPAQKTISNNFANMPLGVIRPGEQVGNIETGNRKTKKANGSWLVGLKEDTVRGVDVSHWQPNFNFQEFVDADKQKNKFLILKMQHATGLTRTFVQQWEALNKIKDEFYYGIYWWPEYYRPDFLTAQIDALRQNLKKFNYSERNMPVSIDIEIERGNVPLDNILKACEMVQDMTPGNKPPILYVADWWWRKYSVPNDTRFSNYQLWVANWNVSRPTLPIPWSDFSIWQAGISTMPGKGFSGPVDQNIFNGSLSEFKKVFKV